MFWKKKEDDFVLAGKLKQDAEKAKLRELQMRAEEYRERRRVAEERQRLRNEIREDKDLIRKERYRHVIGFGKRVQGSVKRLGESDLFASPRQAYRPKPRYVKKKQRQFSDMLIGGKGW